MTSTLISLHGSLWKENFNFHELKHIVRQKDQQFAQLLNRVRAAELTEDDEAMLKARVTTLDDPQPLHRCTPCLWH